MLNQDILKLQIAILIMSNAKKLGWTAKLISNRIHIRKKKSLMTNLDKNHEHLVMVLANNVYLV